MYGFPRFATNDPGHAIDLVRRHPFALVVSAAGGVPVATHAPVLIESPVETTFVGATLLGHLARVNPQWRTWERSPDVLVVFSGPDGYVSPTTFLSDSALTDPAGTDPAVPTWNYAAVHLTGTVELITDAPGALDVVGRTVDALESARTPAWHPNAASRERFAAIVQGVVAFRVRVRAEQSLFKLSQDKGDALRDRVRADATPELAELMDRVDPR